MFSTAVVLSFIIYLAVGWAVGRRIRTVDDYYVAGRRAPVILVSGSLVASFLRTVSFMGAVGFAYDGYPIPLLILVALNVCGYVIGVLLFGRYLRRAPTTTVPEFFGQRFKSTRLQAIAGLTVIIGLGLYLVAVTQGVSLVVADVFGLDFGWALLITWLSFVVFTLIGGSPGVLVTDTIMYIIFTVAGVTGMAYIVAKAGGPLTVVSRLAAFTEKPGILSWHGITGDRAYMGQPGEVLIWAIILGLVWAAVVAISPWQTSRYLMARNENVALQAGFVAMASILVLYVFLAFGGAAINLFSSDISPSETAFIWAARSVLPPFLGAVVEPVAPTLRDRT